MHFALCRDNAAHPLTPSHSSISLSSLHQHYDELPLPSSSSQSLELSRTSSPPSPNHRRRYAAAMLKSHSSSAPGTPYLTKSNKQSSSQLLTKARSYATFRGKPGAKEIRDRHRGSSGQWSITMESEPNYEVENERESKDEGEDEEALDVETMTIQSPASSINEKENQPEVQWMSSLKGSWKTSLGRACRLVHAIQQQQQQHHATSPLEEEDITTDSILGKRR